jgi:hypothetical protein
MLGPVLQASLVSLRLSLGQFYSGVPVRTALGLQSNQLLIYYWKVSRVWTIYRKSWQFIYLFIFLNRAFAGTANEEPNYLERGRCRKRRKLRFVVVNRRLVGCFQTQNQQSTCSSFTRQWRLVHFWPAFNKAVMWFRQHQLSSPTDVAQFIRFPCPNANRFPHLHATLRSFIGVFRHPSQWTVKFAPWSCR